MSKKTEPQIIRQAKALLMQQTTKHLLEQFIETGKEVVDENKAIVRGWLMDEFERRNPKGMALYYDGFYEDSDLERFIL